ncbi:bifunctional proline dehydrogenase/L-glutamate gamma-semialdehyde dehydrogenase PutA [Limnobacter humi]|uniref:Arginase n=1 Tax=Limnobacter humi TaxID=1778671 RepID=A0ABT1WCL8_9BURK|nr:bifunctional proline dehydrogenase/L-glutamate gamma-semialdehyde dehydrogenase PutA [Limnobacter humi]MCQ8895262.1 bifunctional proline dehydrogenase/L-glutamate gamma-semialdehyde dehydrogenase PutA [Limnobacter humi]
MNPANTPAAIKNALCVVGAPTDVGTTYTGCAGGPAALRCGGLVAQLTHLGWAVQDVGDLQGPAVQHRHRVDGYRNLPEAMAWVTHIRDAVAQALHRGEVPLLLGGDHSLAMGSIAAVAAHCKTHNRPLRVVWVDAHADINTAKTSPSGNLHGMPLAALCGWGPAELLEVLNPGHAAPCLQSGQITQIGVRSVDPGEQGLLDESQVQVFTMQHIRELGMDAVMQRALQGVEPGTHVHVSFDVDCLDPQDAPGVGTPVAGGPSLQQMQQCMLRLAQTGCVGSVDLVEFNPSADLTGQTLQHTLALLRMLLDQRHGLRRLHRMEEAQAVSLMLENFPSDRLDDAAIERRTLEHIHRVRQQRSHAIGVDVLMQEFGLSTDEGVALMSLAEALLRIPDPRTREALIQDKLSHADWKAHLGHSDSTLVNAATWGLLVASKLKHGSERLVRRAVELAVGIMGKQFVMAETIEAGLLAAQSGPFCSFDMLGEAAQSDAEAQGYLRSYHQAIDCLQRALQHRPLPAEGFHWQAHSLSIKLSALHPRYETAQREQVHASLYPRLLSLCLACKSAGLLVNLDAEESERLELSMDLFERLALEPALQGWQGLGWVIQAYQTRAPAVVDWVIQLARTSGRHIPVRLVKGAYWDSEIKKAQQQGLSAFPVFTQKVHTDLSYALCAWRLLQHHELVLPQLATHNAHTYALVEHMVQQQGVTRFELQCLFGMGESLYSESMHTGAHTTRVYAPIGAQAQLLPYLVRRLLENGANTSFVNQLLDPHIDPTTLAQHPWTVLHQQRPTANPACRMPAQVYDRPNSPGIDLHCPATAHRWAQALAHRQAHAWLAYPVLPASPHASKGPWRDVFNPAAPTERVGQVQWSTPDDVQQALRDAAARAAAWSCSAHSTRVACMNALAVELSRHAEDLMALLVLEAGKTWANALAEWREAIDFCFYYAAQLERLPENPGQATGGVAVCISPWNFPLAIFMGQIAAALAAGYPVIAKPAEQTPLIAHQAMQCIHRALARVHQPTAVVQCLPGDGTVGQALCAAQAVRLVMFTGSLSVARLIEASLLKAAGPRSPAQLVAETGGQNALWVDSSAHLEQVVQDVLHAAFDSAGQRCSALRLLCVHSSIADTLLNKLKAALATRTLGNPIHPQTDMGPMIDGHARDRVQAHVLSLESQGMTVWQCAQHRRQQAQQPGYFLAPALVEVHGLDLLAEEVFGPVLHVWRCPAGVWSQRMAAVNALGYGLTAGVHSRLGTFQAWVQQRARVGNLYINRNQVGAVVGSQPFGGRGLSGTGPKAGGPLMLPFLMHRAEWSLVQAASAPPGLLLPGPTGERNTYHLLPRSLVWCTAQEADALLLQVMAVCHAGAQACILHSATLNWPRWLASLPEPIQQRVQGVHTIDWTRLDGVLCEHDSALQSTLRRQLLHHCAALVPVIVQTSDGVYPLYRLFHEQAVCNNTAATGGNVDLLSSPAPQAMAK